MTPRERLITAIERREPDRLPVMELAIDWSVMQRLGYRGFFEMIEGLDLDAVPGNQVVYIPEGQEQPQMPQGTFKDNWGVQKRITSELLPYVVDHPLKHKRDLTHLKAPDPERDPAIAAIERTAQRMQKRRAVVFLGRAVFTDTWFLYGMENILECYVEDPQFVLDLSGLAMEYNKRLHRLAIEAGADVVVLGDDYAHKLGPLMSPAHFEQFVLPGLSEVVSNIKSCGAYCIKHTDGNIWPIIDAIVETGIDGIGPLEPLAGMDLARVKARHGDKVCVVGNVDVDLLCRGAPETVHDETARLIRSVSPGGGHILSSGNSIASCVRPANLRAMIAAAQKLGRYPIGDSCEKERD